MATRDMNLLKDIYCNCQQLSNSHEGVRAVPGAHDHGPRRRRTSAIHLFRSTQGGQVRARWCVQPQPQSRRLSLGPASSTLRSLQAFLMSLSFAVFSIRDGAVLCHRPQAMNASRWYASQTACATESEKRPGSRYRSSVQTIKG